jgi:hypothetical protein
MYCASCGTEIDEGTSYCPSCGHEIGTDPTASSSSSTSRDISRDVCEDVSRDSSSATSSVDAGADYDIVMSIEDALRRRTAFRLVMDVIALLVTAGFWAGWLAVEFISHHYNLKKGKTKPYEEGDEKTFNIM